VYPYLVTSGIEHLWSVPSFVDYLNRGTNFNLTNDEVGTVQTICCWWCRLTELDSLSFCSKIFSRFIPFNPCYFCIWWRFAICYNSSCM